MSGAVIRVQDRYGRGPYRPGMSARWRDPIGFECPPWWIELGLGMDEAHERMVGDYHFGSAFRTNFQLNTWFTAREQAALDRLGYKLAAVTADIVIAETPRQVVIGSRQPLWQPVRFCRLGSAAAHGLAA